MTQTSEKPKLPPVLTSPYVGLDEDAQRRLNATISNEDWVLIRAVCPIQGTFNCIVGSIIKHIANELRLRGTTTYDPDSVITILHECTNTDAHRHAGAPNDPRPAPGLPTAHPSNASVAADVSSPTPSGGKRPGRGGRHNKPEAPVQD